MKLRLINWLVRFLKVDTNKISDGYHTFGELYEHRINNYTALCSVLNQTKQHYSILKKLKTHKTEPLVWRSAVHSDGSVMKGWFILGIGTKPEYQITYHLPMELWGQAYFAQILPKAPEFDGHTSKDVLERLKTL